MLNGFEEYEFTIKHSAIWLIDKTLKTATEILFALKDDMERNKKIPFGIFVVVDNNGRIQPPSGTYWEIKMKTKKSQTKI